MHPFTKVVILFVFILSISACGKAELKITICDDVSSDSAECQKEKKVADINDNWIFNLAVDFSQCDAIQNYQNIFSVTIKGSNDNLVIISPFGSFDGSFNQNKLSWSGQYYDEHVEKYLSFSNVNVLLQGNSLSGSGIFEVSDSIQTEFQCAASFILTGRAISNLKNDLVAPEAKAFEEGEITDRTAVLRWIDRSVNEENFVIERSLNDISGFEIIGKTLANQESFKDSGLTENTTYFYRIKAINNMAESEYSTVIMLLTAVSPTQVPTAPTNLTSPLVQVSKVYLEWFDNSNNELGFIIERSEDQGGDYQNIFETTNDTTLFKDTTLKALTEYLYRVTAFNDAGLSDATNVLTVTTSGSLPTAPESLTINSKTDDAIHIVWANTITNGQSIIVERRQYSDTMFVVIATLGENSLGYQDSALDPETTYCYRIKASNIVGDSEYSSVLCEATDAPPLTEPNTPDDLIVTASKTNLSFVLTWTDVENETAYEVERSLDSLSGFELIITLPPNAQTYIDSKDLSKDTLYWYRIRAINSTGESDYTLALKSISPGNPKPVTNLLAIIIDNDTSSPSITLTWTNPDNILSIDVQRKENLQTNYQTIATFDNATQNTYDDYNVIRGNTYYYQIITKNSVAPTVAMSETFSLTIPSPPAPENIQATADTNGQGASFSWQEDPKITSYRVERSTSENAVYSDISGILAGSSTEFFDTDLLPGTLYYYRIYATSLMGETYIQKILSTPGLPKSPDSFEVSANTFQSAANVSWVDGLTETGYEIQYSLSFDGQFDASVIVDQDITKLTINLFNSNTAYFFRMRAINNVGYSDFTEVKEIQTAQPAFAVASLALRAGLNANSVTLDWSASSNAQHYRIERRGSTESDFSVLEDLISNTINSYIDTDNLITGETYDYRLFSVNVIGENFVQDNVRIPTEIFASKAPFSYRGWTVTNGDIDINATDESVCGIAGSSNLNTTTCNLLMKGNGFIQFSVSPPVTSFNLDSFIMTILTDVDATGDADTLSYYHINTVSIEAGLGNAKLTKTSVIHSQRKGLPTPLPSTNNTGIRQLYQGEITGILVSETNVSTGKVVSRPNTDTFTIAFTFDANAAALLDYKWEFIPDTPNEKDLSSGYIGLLPAITSLEISVGGETWKANMGYISSYNFTNYNNLSIPDQNGIFVNSTMEISIDNLIMMAYADPATSGNPKPFFGMDFHGYKYLDFNDTPEQFPWPPEEHDIANPPTGDEFDQMGMSLYFDNGNIILTAEPTGFSVTAIDKPTVSPGALSVLTKTDNAIQISWANTATDEHNVIIERSTRSNGSYNIVETLDTNATSYEDNLLASETRYCYRAKFVYVLGVSRYSPVLCVTTYPIIPKPINVEANQNVESLSIKLNWITSPDVQNYRIERRTSFADPYIDVSGMLAGDVNTFVDPNLLPNTQYFYRVYAIGNLGENYVDIWTYTPNLPATPLNFNLVATAEPTSVTLSWSAVDNADHYRIERSNQSNCCFLFVNDLIPATQTSYVDTDSLVSGETYYYRFYSVNALGETQTQNRVVVPKKIVVNKAPFSYNGWTVTNGQIDYSTLDICLSVDFICQSIFSTNGFVQLHVMPNPIAPNYVIEDNIHVMTIFTDVNANGNYSTVNYFHINTSRFYLYDAYFYLSEQRLPINSTTHSERKGLPTPLPIVNQSGNQNLFQGQIVGSFIREYDVLTSQETPYITAKPFTINFDYDANVIDQVYKGQSSFGSDAYAMSLRPAITSIKITSEENTWSTNMGYISSYEKMTANNVSDSPIPVVSGFRIYMMTAYANPDLTLNDNNSEFYGIDFNSSKIFAEIKDTPTPPVIEHQLENPPAAHDFQQFSISVYLNEGNTQLVGIVTDLKIKPVVLPSTVIPIAPILKSVFSKTKNSMQLIWIDTATNEDKLILERAEFSNYIFTEIAMLDANSSDYSDSLLTTGTNYCYRTKFRNATGDSAYSNVLCGLTKAEPPIPLSPPNIPSGFSITDIKTSLGNQLNWTGIKNNYEEFYEIERSDNASDSFVQIATLPDKMRSFYDEINLKKNTPYWYRMRAVNSAGTSDYTSALNAGTISAPEAITGFTAITDATNLSVSFNWINSSNTIRLILQRKASSESNYQDIVFYPGITTQTAYTDTNVTAGTTYSYRMVSANYIGSTSSEILIITVPTN